MILSMRNKLCLLAVSWEVGRVPHLIFSFFFFLKYHCQALIDKEYATHLQDVHW